MAAEIKSFLPPIKTSRRHETVVIDDKTYQILEFSGGELSDYMADMARRTKTDAQGRPIGMTDYKDVQSGYVARCLYEQDARGNWVRVELAVINSWSATAVKALFDACQEVNGMVDEKKPDSALTNSPGSE